MRRMFFFASRNRKEMLRDPLSLIFGVGFPVVLLILLHIIQSNIPQEANMNLSDLTNLTPGIGVFGLSFIALFAAMLISKDRTTSLMLRLFASPLRGWQFILGYLLPLVPMSVAQLLVCFAAALALGMGFTWNIFLCILVCIPIAVLHMALGFLCGSLLSDKAVGGVCGALLTNFSAWLSGTWFSLDLVGGAFKKIAYILPFANAVDAGRAALAGEMSSIFPKLWIVIAWAVGTLLISILVFRHKMKLK